MYCRFCGNLQDTGELCSKCAKPITSTGKPSEIEGNLEEAFIGKNYGFYMNKWSSMKAKRQKRSWNWASFFLGPLWFGYRKMYMPILLIALIYLAVDFIFYLDGYNYSLSSFSDPVESIVYFPLSIAFGMLGNHFYLKHKNKHIDKAVTLFDTEEQQRSWLRKKGRTSWVGVLLAVLILMGYGVTTTLLIPTNIDQIQYVQGEELPDYPTVTVGEALNEFFSSGFWETESKKSPYDIVRFSGLGYYQGEAAYIVLDFSVKDDDIGIHTVTVDNEELSEGEMGSLIDDIFQ